jgi:hypothetical protein
MGAGMIGFLVVLGLVVAAIFLFRSMSKHLRKVPSSFDDPNNNPHSTVTPPPKDPPPS